MTGGTSRRETSRHVIRIVRRLVVRLVAAETVGGNRGVVVVHMTTGACNRCVRAGQGETGVVVIETRRAPGCGAMAHIALLRKARRNMVRVVRVVEIIQVAADAGCVRKVVVPVRVALAALQA